MIQSAEQSRENADAESLIAASYGSVVIANPVTHSARNEQSGESNATAGNLDKGFDVIAKKKGLKNESAEIELVLPDNVSAARGEIVTTPVRLNNTANKQIAAYSFAVRFDPAVLQLLEDGSINAAETLSANGFVIASDANTPGRIGVAASSVNQMVNDSGTLLNLRFKVVGAVSSNTVLRFDNGQQNETSGGIGSIIFEDYFGNRIASSVNDGAFATAGKSFVKARFRSEF